MNYIYVLASKTTAVYKIGYSSQPQVRIGSIRTSVPNLIIIDLYFGTRADEAALHQMFNAKRVNREWFALNGSDLKKIKEYFSDHDQQADNLRALCVQMLSAQRPTVEHSVRIKKYKTKNAVPSSCTLSTEEVSELKRRGLSLKSARVVKNLWFSNPYFSMDEIADELGCSKSLVSKALACLRKFTNESVLAQTFTDKNLQPENQ